MGQRSARETFLGIITAFIQKRTWTQAELARSLDVGTPAVRKHLRELQANGWKLEESREGAQVYWSVPKNWFPGGLIFKPEEVPDLLRLLLRSPKTDRRERLLAAIRERLPLKDAAPLASPALRAQEVPQGEEEWLAVLEDAAARKIAVKMRYFSTSRRDESTRHVSVLRLELGPRPRFIAMCHRAGALKWFRVSNVLHAKADESEPFRDAPEAAVTSFERESLGGYREVRAPIECAFFVRQPEAAWVARNLPEPMSGESVDGGVRVTVSTTALTVVARFVVALGEAAHCETPELAAAVVDLANGALRQAAQRAS
jgi:predicted DNA-binding transcriptional regulator YafY